MDSEDTRFLSRKFILTGVVLLLSAGVPLIYKANAVSDMITMTVLVIFAAVGTAYGFINVKDAKIDLQKNAQEILSQKDESNGETPK